MAALAAACLPFARAQLALGVLEGSVADSQGRPARLHIEIAGPPGIRLSLDSVGGHFRAALPYGDYTVRAPSIAADCAARIHPFETVRCDLRAGESRASAVEDAAAGPALFRYPVDFSGVAEIRLPLLSFGAASWTDTRFRLNGLDATDSYQPGRPLLFDDPAATDTSLAPGAYTAGFYLRGAASGWHGGLATSDTGSAFAGDNLPAPADRGSVQRLDEFRWLTGDTAELSGPLSRWADIAATAIGRWGSQTDPQNPAPVAIRSRMLFANARGRLRFGDHDQVDALYSGSRLDLSDGGWPAGIEAILAARALPVFYGVNGFSDLSEVDHMDHVQAGWTHLFAAAVLEVRYGYSTAHLDTAPASSQPTPARIDLLDLAPQDAPLTNFAIRTRHQFAAAYQTAERRFARSGHLVTAGGIWETSQPRNRFDVPGGQDLISAGGQPAFVVRFNTPTETRDRIDSFAPYVADAIRWDHGLMARLALALDGARGGPIHWIGASPSTGIAWSVPRLSRLVLRGNYARIYAPLAGRYLDFADPTSLSGLIYDAASSQLLQRFGGAYSTIAPHLARPYTDQFRLSAQAALPMHSAFTVDLSRSDLKHRLAAVNTGVPFSDYSPVVIRDPGPDFQPGTFDDQLLTVYAQNPSTLGRDQYLLTNPAGLRELTESLTAGVSTRRRYADLRLSFTTEKSFGPTNPGSSAWVNDPGIVGALYSEPNSLLNATGHPFVDRAFLARIEEVTVAPSWLGGVRIVNALDYMDGLPFARELLVTGLPQGPILVDTTLRGSPEGGNRAQYVLNWNLRIGREFPVGFGRVGLTADIRNLLDNANKIEESDLSGPQFNQRPALALPPPRMIRLGLRWQF